jgi:small-conductance mechanosensitive channel
MARGDAEREEARSYGRLEAKVEMLERLVDEKDKEIVRLYKQVDSLQEALVVKEAPALWADRKQMEADNSVSPEQHQQMLDEQNRNAVLSQYCDQLTEPTFTSAEDLEAAFLPTLIRDSEPGPTGPEGYENES